MEPVRDSQGNWYIGLPGGEKYVVNVRVGSDGKQYIRLPGGAKLYLPGEPVSPWAQAQAPQAPQVQVGALVIIALVLYLLFRK